ncbi:hypothetical protein [uncultured Duncaniella sp.]|uniref:hypothetical protein n=1 Tax=uncultured Duncaniella sp. TaxID=2768039 RepID=UPI002614973C|nr:hypothetical protein [uncultured Duncaniella sp.]
MKPTKTRNTPHKIYHDPDKPKILKKYYHVTAQTAYHIARLAIQEGTSEGRIIDKIMRTYLAESGTNRN